MKTSKTTRLDYECTVDLHTLSRVMFCDLAEHLH